MRKSASKNSSLQGWHLYWVESDGVEDCFVVARNKRSACSVEIHMNGFDPAEVNAVRITKIPPNAARAYGRENPDRGWPGYVYGRLLFENIGAQFREINDKKEMLLLDAVYEVEDYAPCYISFSRFIGDKAISNLRSDSSLSEIKYHDEDIFDGPEIHLITALGMCLAMCQRIEYYISNSFLLGASKKQKEKYQTINDMRNGWRKKTLGNMIRSIEEAWDIHPLLKANLEIFLQNRNLLVHGITTDDRYDIRTRWGCDELLAFLYFFDLHARVVKAAFRSSFYASIDFGILTWGRPPGMSKRAFGRKHEKEAAMFFEFFTMKDGQI